MVLHTRSGQGKMRGTIPGESLVPFREKMLIRRYRIA
jgi:hypothetical protein